MLFWFSIVFLISLTYLLFLTSVASMASRSSMVSIVFMHSLTYLIFLIFHQLLIAYSSYFWSKPAKTAKIFQDPSWTFLYSSSPMMENTPPQIYNYPQSQPCSSSSFSSWKSGWPDSRTSHPLTYPSLSY